MDIAKNAALFLQALAVSILGLTFAGVKADSLPMILQPLFFIPWYLYMLLFVGLLVVVITQKEKLVHITSTTPVPELKKVGDIEYQGVKWDIRAPPQRTLEKQADYAKRLPDIIEVKIPPRCPKCGVELEEKKGLIYGHIWRCVSCGYAKRNKDAFSVEAGRAEKIWRGKAEAETLPK
jgi:ribosomal protein L37AE/L43A